MTLALGLLASLQFRTGFVGTALILAEVMLLIGLDASFAHLGRLERAWRAALMWRTSWLSREVIVPPGLVAQRWFFFAQAKHSQNLYCQVVS